MRVTSFAPATSFDQLSSARSDNQFGANQLCRERGRCVRDGGLRFEGGAVELLDEELAVTARYRDSDISLVSGSRGNQAERRHTANLGGPTDREAVRRSNSDPDSSETTRADTDENAISTTSLQELGDHRHEPLRVATTDIVIGAANTAP